MSSLKKLDEASKLLLPLQELGDLLQVQDWSEES